MPALNRFPQFPALPPEVRGAIFERAAIGPQVAHLTVRHKGPNLATERAIRWRELQEVEDSYFFHLFYLPMIEWSGKLIRYYESLVQLSPSPDECGDEAKENMQDVAVICKEARSAVSRVLAATDKAKLANTLYVLRTEREKPWGRIQQQVSWSYLTGLPNRYLNGLMPVFFPPDPATRPITDVHALPFWGMTVKCFDLDVKAKAVACHWQFRARNCFDVLRLWDAISVPEEIETIYIIDESRPLRLSSQSELRKLDIRAGPWYDSGRAFVDWQRSLQEQLAVRPYNDAECSDIGKEVAYLEKLTESRARRTPPLKPAEVRMLTLVIFG